MKRILFFGLFLFLGLSASKAQNTGSWMLHGGLDVIKTDNYGLFEKAQIGLEANYFVRNNFSASGGVEIWRNTTRVALGMRFYPVQPVYIRFRGLIGDNSDANLGFGYAHPIGGNLKWDFIGDYYFDQGEFAIRTGLSIIL
ncbi:hypothetical protein [Mangrovivirga cuniculi]|uniref:Outer membrane protein beta-barrel domain-containing protein n=1 Tax=Mangrovivirga cuniculi TaxID=2715131 RepID=A0A4D7JZT7_9BACT|nr:hypothetical protein [Mangrovivirga cuniculi]QCK14174.1 hypothetical protein DCC35_05155 [Mangrovivirga cuniculi]